MNSYEWIMYAGMAVWLGLGLYLCLLARKQLSLSRRVSRMAVMMEKSGPEETGPEGERGTGPKQAPPLFSSF